MPFRQHLHGLVANAILAILFSAVDRELLTALSEVTTIRLLQAFKSCHSGELCVIMPIKFGGIP
jgi:hypothetical protein